MDRTGSPRIHHGNRIRTRSPRVPVDGAGPARIGLGDRVVLRTVRIAQHPEETGELAHGSGAVALASARATEEADAALVALNESEGGQDDGADDDEDEDLQKCVGDLRDGHAGAGFHPVEVVSGGAARPPVRTLTHALTRQGVPVPALK